MKPAILAAAAAFALSMGPSAVLAQNQEPPPEEFDETPTALDFWISGWDTSDSRKDAREAARPLPPSGPATPVPLCSPSSPFCQ